MAARALSSSWTLSKVYCGQGHFEVTNYEDYAEHDMPYCDLSNDDNHIDTTGMKLSTLVLARV